jgi:S-adenosyl-L-methionine hydrolase (adenosine-forming)
LISFAVISNLLSKGFSLSSDFEGISQALIGYHNRGRLSNIFIGVPNPALLLDSGTPFGYHSALLPRQFNNASSSGGTGVLIKTPSTGGPNPAMKPSGIITLTSDFGLSDPYVAMMKGVILSINPSAVLVDISHHIGAGSISQAARLVHESFGFFPAGTVHLSVVDPGVGSARRLIAVKGGGHFFVGPDNGIFWPILQSHEGAMIVHLQDRRFFLPSLSQTFHGREVFAPVSAHISLGVPLDRMGPSIEDPVELLLPLPYEREGALFGEIARVDNFGNLITNISSKDLSRFLGSGRPRFEIGKLLIPKLSRIYAEVEEGTPVALINSSNMLEIAVNLGRASEYVGLRDEDMIGAMVRVTKA